MTEINIPINLESRRRGITFIYLTKFDGSNVLYGTIETFDNLLVSARYDGFEKFVKESEAQLLAHPSCFAAEDIEWLKNYLITKRKAFEDAAKELRE